MTPTADAKKRFDVGRALDISITLVALIFLAPLMVLIALAIWANDGGTPLFRQARVGRHGELFYCLKFRSMVLDADRALHAFLETDPQAKSDWGRDHKLKIDPRITRLGRFIRTSSIDELPQLFNVLGGHMSLVGPRPIVPDEIGRYGAYFGHYCRMRPGITGLWQVSGRNNVSYRRRVACDVLYSRRQGWRTYLSILVATVPAVTMARGSY